jgi:hypothetical protein
MMPVFGNESAMVAVSAKHVAAAQQVVAAIGFVVALSVAKRRSPSSKVGRLSCHQGQNCGNVR